MKRALLVLTAAACASAPPRAVPPQRFAPATATPTFDPELKRQVSEAIPRLEESLREQALFPGLAVGLVAGDELIWFGASGSRDDRGAPIDEHTLFRLGSITKVITGLALLQLRDAGKLSFDEPASTYLPELGGVIYPTRDSPAITIRHLVTHTSGLPVMGGVPLAGATEAQLLASLDGLALEAAPGTRVAYSNLAMALAGLIVARVSGEPYRDYVERHILAPLGMRETVWDGENVAPERIATPHKDVAGKPVAQRAQTVLGAMEPAGGLYTTMADAAKLVAFELGAEPAREEGEVLVVRRGTLRESQRIAGHSPPDEHAFGVNWVLFRDPELGRVVFHNGSTGDYAASIWMLPDRKIGLIAFTNSGSSGLLDRVSRAALIRLVEGLPIVAPELGAPTAVALERLIAILAAPTREAIVAAFSPTFLASVAAEEVEAAARHLDPGKCRATPLAVKSPQQAIVRLDCERGAFDLLIRVEAEAPHLIVHAQIDPAAAP